MTFSVFSYLSLFLLIFDLAIPGMGRIGSAPLSAIISLCWLVTHPGKHGVRERGASSPLICLYASIFFVVVVRLAISLAGEMSFFWSAAKSSTILLATLLYVRAFLRKETAEQIINVFALNAIICLVCGSFPDYLQYVYLFKLGLNEPGYIPYRNAFLSGSGYYGIGAPYAVVFLFAMMCFVRRDQNKLADYVKIMLIATAGVLAARTVFVGIAFGLIYLGYRRPPAIFAAGALLGAVILGLITFEGTAQYSDWMFEFFAQDPSTSTGSRSTDELSSMYFVPGASTFVFGDGKYTSGDLYYMETDGGYMRHILFGGLPLTVLILLIPVVLARMSRSRDYYWFLLPLVYVLHIKGNFIYNSPAGMPLIIIIAFWIRSFGPERSCCEGSRPFLDGRNVERA